MKPNDTNDSRYRAAYLAHVLAALPVPCDRPSPHVAATLVLDMQRASRAARAWETRCCNHPLTEAQWRRGDRRIQKLRDGINARLRTVWPCALPPRLALGGDPRGPCATLFAPGQEGDGWTSGEGWFAVY